MPETFGPCHLSFDRINCNFNIKAYESLWMYMLSMSWSCSQPIILFTATTLPLSWLTSFPLFPSSCRVISWWVRSGCSVTLKFGTSMPTTDHVTTRGLCDVTAVWSDGDMKLSYVLQIDTLWWFFEDCWVSRLGLKKEDPSVRIYYTQCIISFEPLGRVT